MWVEFFLAMPVFFLLLYLPGYLVSRGLTRDPFVALAMAPLVSSCAYSALSIVYGTTGIYTTWVVIVVPVVLCGAIFLFLMQRRRKAVGSDQYGMRLRKEELESEIKIYLPYVIFGALVCLVFFIKQLDGPSSFTWRTDNTQHLNLIARFVSSGSWSMLHTSLYEDPTQAAILGSYFYPAGWHVLVALLASTLGASPVFSANVANAVLIAITIPTSQYILIRVLFPDKPDVVRLGAVFPLAFGVFPWHIIIPEAKESFFFGLVLAPAFMALFITTCEGLLKRRLDFGSFVLTILGFLASALAHPCCVFSEEVLLVPYCVWALWRFATPRHRITRAKEKGKKAFLAAYLKPAFLIIAFLGLVVVVWRACYFNPTIYEMTTWIHWAYTSRTNAVIRVAFMGFKDVPIQPVLAVFVWTGVAYSIYRKRYLWMTSSFLIFGLFYVVDATTDQIIKRWLTGFWYTDFNRLAASACIVAVPLAALGLFAWVKVFQWVFRSVSVKADDRAQKFASITLPTLISFVSAMFIFYPSFGLPHVSGKIVTAFGYTAQRGHYYNSFKHNMLSLDEMDFLTEVGETVGDDLVLNFPYDGSCYAYATTGLNVYARRISDVYLSDDARIIAARIDGFATDTEVRGCVNELDAHYVLLLDIDEGNEELATIYDGGYNANSWHGFVSIGDDTPGFEVVLSEGDMRLYRIVE